MQNVLLVTSLILVTLFSPSFSVTPCSCTFYQNAQYSGNSFVLKGSPAPGTYVPNLGLNGYNFNDQISSFQCTPGSDGSKCWIHACWNAQCSSPAYGGSIDYIDDMPYVGGFANDEFSALYVTTYMPNVDPYVYYYKSCIGNQQDYGWFSIGNQNIFASTLETNCIGNDQLSAVVVSLAAAVILYKDDNYQNDYLLLTGETVNCLTQWSGWNDVTSSIRQYDLSKGQAFNDVVGQWQIVGSGTNLVQSITIGYITQEQTTTTNTLEQQLSLSMEAGIDFEGFSAKTTVSSTTTSTVSNSVQSSVTEQYTSSWTVSCDGTANCVNAGGSVILYSFGMTFTRPWMSVPGFDYTLSLATENTLCICSGYTPPQCPPTYCNDNVPYRCNVCKPF